MNCPSIVNELHVNPGSIIYNSYYLVCTQKVLAAIILNVIPGDSEFSICVTTYCKCSCFKNILSLGWHQSIFSQLHSFLQRMLEELSLFSASGQWFDFIPEPCLCLQSQGLRATSFSCFHIPGVLLPVLTSTPMGKHPYLSTSHQQP